MNKIVRKLTLTCVISALIVALTPSPAQAITNGFPDTSNRFSNVGAVLALPPDSSEAFQVCSGTLISPTVF
jgi:hypothetical protein